MRGVLGRHKICQPAFNRRMSGQISSGVTDPDDEAVGARTRVALSLITLLGTAST